MNQDDLVHAMYVTQQGRKSICGVCLRRICFEIDGQMEMEFILSKITCQNCIRILKETDILIQIDDL